MVHQNAVTVCVRVPIVRLRCAEEVFALAPNPLALLIDIEGTLTEFDPSATAVLDALMRFDQTADACSFNVQQINYVSNAKIEQNGPEWVGIQGRLHSRACKPFFLPGEEFCSKGRATLVVGDQYLTDGLLAWRYGLSFALVDSIARAPVWPRAQRSIGRAVAPLFFVPALYTQGARGGVHADR